ncbi:ABC transporter substrate-binding protein [Nocardioides sp. WG-D5]|uniref:ABC transporter substrate-binding protein n=1 Tax=Nocardioides luteus TaxID=1844 RepID=UPI000202923D|nr:sugar ABC transporter substrate-binding protein [Nocardioides luteus]EGD43158.1 solute binding protein of ABC transporter system [Nocardioidaceae bacterium Broad-1]MBG6098022.1 multiple sugar transport system substrate-binding protein [Nocardioides luteus]
MLIISGRRARRRIALVAAALTAASVLAGCGSGDGGGSGGEGTAADLDAALEEGGTITYWTWTPSAEAQVAAFEKQYPNVEVKLVNAGTGNDHYTKLQNAIKAGSGGPDVVQIEYKALPQFALPGDLVDLRQYGFDEFESDYTPSTWASVQAGEGLYGLPQDSGPMALFYNQEVFDEHKLEVPKTWDEYVEAARTIKKENPSQCITNDSGEAGFTTSMIWQAGGTPFESEGENVTIDLQDEGTLKWTGVWNQLIEDELACSIPGWTEEWYKALGDGTIASIPLGAWAPGVFEQSVPDGAGKWRAAPMPTYDGQPATAENGGGTQSVLKQSKNPALAAAFVRWLNHDEGVEPFLESGGFPATVADLEDPAFVDKKLDYFGGQQVNQVLTEAATQVVEGWQYLPYQLYADTIYGDTVGKSYQTHTALEGGLTAWQEALVKYGDEQGFSVN